MKAKFTALLLASLIATGLLLSPTYADELDELYYSEEVEPLFEAAYPLALQGNPKAQFYLGYCIGTHASSKRTINWRSCGHKFLTPMASVATMKGLSLSYYPSSLSRNSRGFFKLQHYALAATTRNVPQSKKSSLLILNVIELVIPNIFAQFISITKT